LIGFGQWFDCINMVCFLSFEDTSHGYASPLASWFFLLLLTCPLVCWLHLFFFLSRLGIGGYLFYISWNLGLVASWYLWCEVCSTYDLLPLKISALPCTSFLLDIIVVFCISLLSFLCFCHVVRLVVKRCALIDFVDDCFSRMVVKRCFNVFSFKWFNLELWLHLFG